MRFPSPHEQVQECVQRNFQFLRSSFRYFATKDLTGGLFCIGQTCFATQLCRDCGITDSVPSCRQEHISEIFVVTNFEADKDSEEGRANKNKAFARFEYIEVTDYCYDYCYGQHRRPVARSN